MEKTQKKRPSSKELKQIVYKNKKNSILSRMFKSILLIIVIPIAWYLAFMYYPLSTMVDITGTVTERHLKLSYGRFRDNPSRNYIIRLDDYTSPIRFQSSKKNPFLGKDVVGKNVTVQIQKKDLEKLNTFTLNNPLNEYNSPDLMKLPRMYGIKEGNKVIITSQYALWDAPTPFVVAELSLWGGGLVILIAIYLLFYDSKCLYKLIKTKELDY